MRASEAATSSLDMPAESRKARSSIRWPVLYSMHRTRRRAQRTSGTTSGIDLVLAKYSRVRMAFSPSRRKLSSCGSETSISSESHVKSYSGKAHFNVRKVKRVSERSMGAQSSSSGCWHFTATDRPVALSTARWTCAKDAEPIGVLSKDEKRSVKGALMSFSIIFFIDSKLDIGHLSCKGMNVSHHSTGRR